MASLDIGSGTDDQCDVNLDITALENVDVLGDMHSLPFQDNTFDKIYLNHVLEHSHHPIEVLEEIHRVGKPRGEVYINVPHGFSVRGIRDPTHNQYFSLRSIEHVTIDSENLPAWYSDAEFEIVDSTLIAGRPNDFGASIPLRKVLVILSRLLNHGIIYLANSDPEIFEPFVALSSKTDIHWELRIIDDT